MTRPYPLGDRDEFMEVDYYDRWLESSDPDDVESTLCGVYDYIKMLEAFILSNKRGSCWCPISIGHPSFSDHTPSCKGLQEFFEAYPEL